MRSQGPGDQADLPAHRTFGVFLSLSVHSRWLLGPLFSLPHPFPSLL